MSYLGTSWPAKLSREINHHRVEVKSGSLQWKQLQATPNSKYKNLSRTNELAIQIEHQAKSPASLSNQIITPSLIPHTDLKFRSLSWTLMGVTVWWRGQAMLKQPQSKVECRKDSNLDVG